jgi:hypothetical protein
MKNESYHSNEHWEKLAMARRLAMLLDSAFTVPGTGQKVGLDAILGVLPIAGDMLSFLISLYIVFLAQQSGVSNRRLAFMMFNVFLDTLVGAVPVLGDILDVFWKANQHNVNLLERHLQEQSGGIKPRRRFGRLLQRRAPLSPAETTIDIVPVRRQKDTF